ncbi:MAG: prepilin-type N-terminal cleavage/methylation domain-containing protein [Lentisphaeria bacterium]|nr:prepilin-type N-terminal cleavage/methylation domain-containing protein [Lentisphaeria bacterium]
MNRKTSHNFTLIELLIVIAIIGILAGMLMPALGKAKDRSTAISCVNNQKQLGTASSLYIDDNRGCIPGATGGWCCGRGTWVGKNISQRRVDLRTKGTVASYTDPVSKGCPAVIAFAIAQLGPESADGSATAQSVGTCRGSGFGWNVNAGFRNLATGAARLNASRILKPSQAVLLSDSQLEWSAGMSVYPYYLTPRTTVSAAGGGSWGATQAFRHSNRANCLWADGHVSSEVPGELGTGAYALENNLGWLGPDDRYYCLTREDYEELNLVP